MPLFPDAEMNDNSDYIAGKTERGSTNPAAEVRIYDDASRTTLLATIVLHTTAFHAAGAQGGLGAGSQPATPGKAWLDVTTGGEPEDAVPDANGDAAFAEIVDLDEDVIMQGNASATPGDFIELNAIGILTTVPVKITNGFILFQQGSL